MSEARFQERQLLLSLSIHLGRIGRDDRCVRRPSHRSALRTTRSWHSPTDSRPRSSTSARGRSSLGLVRKCYRTRAHPWRCTRTT